MHFSRAALLIALAVCTSVRGDDDVEKKAIKELEGVYTLIGYEGGGVKLTEDMLNKPKELQTVFQGNRMLPPEGVKDEPSIFKLDATKSPARIDITSKKNGKSVVGYGIYKLEDGILTLCGTEDGEEKDRPKEFKAEGKVSIMIFRKQPAK